MPKIPTKKHITFDEEKELLSGVSDSLRGNMKHTNLDYSIYTKKNWEKQNNIIIGIAVGVMVVACGIIYVAINVNS